MTTLTDRSSQSAMIFAKSGRKALAIDKVVKLEINGSTQTLRMCADRGGLPSLFIVQAGPGFPLLQEIPKFRQRLNLEKDFLVTYWDQRGCGPAPQADAESVSLQQQVDDVCAVLRWLKHETGQPATVLCISLGATFALQAAERERDSIQSLVAISPDANIPASDAYVSSFLRAQSAQNPRLHSKLAKLGEPPYLDPARLQARARLLADLGCLERGKRFGALLWETLYSLVRTYGLGGMVRAMRNMNRVQRKMLPEIASLDLIANPPRLTIPVHCAFGQYDPLVPTEIANQLSAILTAPGSTSTQVPDAGHMVHFDQPEMVRSMIVAAARGGAPVPRLQ